jgi:hypothetical protein
VLVKHDELAPDFCPNHKHYEQLSNAGVCLTVLISECPPSTSPKGHAAVKLTAESLSNFSFHRGVQCWSGMEIIVIASLGGTPSEMGPSRGHG